MRVAAALWVSVWLLPFYVAVGQEVTVPVEDAGVLRDTFSLALPQPFALGPFVLPASEVVDLDGVRLDTAQYRLDVRHGLLWLDEAVEGEQIAVAYRRLPFSFREVYRRRSVRQATASDSLEAVAVIEERADTAQTSDPFGGFALQRSGSVTRGILAGNNRDVTVESGLRMQLSGEIAEGVNVQAVLTDENTPILPEGTTQRLDEFDRVFIQIDFPQGQTQLGDFDLVFAETEFARFTRKLQGAKLSGELPDPQTSVFGGGTVTVAGAAARGLYRQQDIEPIEGVQGPYRLEGTQGERFILVVPGSEVVYLDGVRMVRGETNDYTIDYATAEVTFTPQRLVTSDRRITVEFQYTANQFSRTIVGSQGQAALWQRADGTARARVGATFLREADSRQFSGAFDLTAADSLLLRETGDDPAFRSGAERVAFDPEAPYVQYVRESRGTDSIFVALSTAPPLSEPVYRVRFSRVGAGQGAYVREGRSVNGILYVYRGPGLGDYAPVRVLPRPQQKRLLDLVGGFEPVRGVEIFGEWARSLSDENRLSDVDAADDQDDAYLTGLRLSPRSVPFGGGLLGNLSAEYRRRHTGENFSAFERTRPIEFGRRWNLTNLSSQIADSLDETTDEAFVQWDVTPRSSLRGEWGRLRLAGLFGSTRQSATARLAEEGLPRVGYQIENIESRDEASLLDGRWRRQLGRIEQPLGRGRFVPLFEIEEERRRQRVVGTDSLARQSFQFVEYRPGLAWRTERLQTATTFEWRTEKDWAEGALRDAARAWTLQSQFTYRPKSSFNVDATAGFRSKRFTPYFREQQQREDAQSVVLRLNTRWLPLQRALDANVFYEALTERTPTLQEIYVRTGPEIGQYVWADGSGENPVADGIIQIDEFLPERTPDEGTYVKTFVPSDDLESVIGVQARARLGLDGAKLFPKPDVRWQRWLANVSTRTTFEVLEKSRAEDLAQIYLLNLHRYRDTTTTINGRLRLAHEISLFRRQSRYGVDLLLNQVRGLNRLATGFEERFLNTWRVESRYKPAVRWGLRLVGALETNRAASTRFSTRSYNIRSASIEPDVSYSPTRSWQGTLGFSYAQKTDDLRDRAARVLKLPVEVRYNRVRRVQLTLNAEVADVRLDGDTAGLAQFELTDGRGPGTSYLWTLGGQYSLNRYLRATLTYNGLAPADAPTLHTVRMQLSAIF